MSEFRHHQPRLLAIDDSILIHRLMKEHLRHEDVELHGAMAGGEGVELAATLRPDCILLDLDLPDISGFDVLRALHAQSSTRDIPVIVVSCHDQTADKVRALDLGAIDFVSKPFQVAELKARVRSAVRQHRLITMLSQRARIDGMTGLWNRAYFDERLAQEVQEARRHGGSVALVMADLDHFKSVNDTWGHPFGDRVIEVFAEILATRRDHDIACRYGGEEFAVIMPRATRRDAAIVAERWRAQLESRHWDRAPNQRITASFGVADLDTAQDGSPLAIVKSADEALYASKEGGRNRVTQAPQHGHWKLSA